MIATSAFKSLKIDELEVLAPLLPGLCTYIVVSAISQTENNKLEAVQAILHGLVYTLIVNAIYAFLLWLGNVTGFGLAAPEIFTLVCWALILAIVVTLLKESGQPIGLLRRIGVTKASSMPGPWASSFHEGPKEFSNWLVLCLKSERRIMGQLRGWSSDQKEGHITLSSCSWLNGDGTEQDTPGMLIIPADDVSLVQFLPKENANDDGRSKTGTGTERSTSDKPNGDWRPDR